MKKIIALLATVVAAVALMFTSVSPANAAHYCKTTPSGVHQTNGNGARGGSDGWRNSSDGIENAEEAGGVEDCGAGNPPPDSNRS